MKARSGFTLVEIMIVVSIIGLLAVFALPSMLKARKRTQTTICIKNLKLISDGIDQWALENFKNEGDDIDVAELSTYCKDASKVVCPTGAGYNFKKVGDEPECDSMIPEHTI